MSKQEAEKSGSKTNVLVLEIEGIKVTKDTMSYTVSGGIKNRFSYFSNIESAMQEVSDRLFHEKLNKRSQQAQSDIKSLIAVIEEQRHEIREKFKIY